MTETRFRQAFLLLLVTAISAAFGAMIRAFLLTILLATIFAGLSYPVYEWILGRIGGRKALADVFVSRDLVRREARRQAARDVTALERAIFAARVRDQGLSVSCSVISIKAQAPESPGSACSTLTQRL